MIKEQEERRRKREEKRRRKRKEKREQEEAERLAHRIAMEERKLLLAQRKLESIRLISELIDRVKVFQFSTLLVSSIQDDNDFFLG